MPNITLNHAIIYKNRVKALESMTHTPTLICQASVLGETPIPRGSIEKQSEPFHLFPVIR